jgi:probable rRNA maturation factor
MARAMGPPVTRRAHGGRRARRAVGLTVTLRRSTRRGWVPGAAALQRWAILALGRRVRGGELALLVVGAARSRTLNRRYRGRDYPTNVLAFPAATHPGAAGEMLGDIVICPDVLLREARAQRKPARAHWMHLFVHGVLHLIGHDHQRAAQARRMEQREVRVLRALGVANPYRSS